MFWGLIMEPQKRYSQKVKKAFHISHAAMDTTTGENEPCQVMVVISGKNFLLCTLQKNKTIQTALDLYFREGDEICFFTNGKCHIHLTGYLDPEFDDELEEEEEDEGDVSNDEVPTLVAQSKKDKKRKREVSPEVPLTKKQRKEQARLKREQESQNAKKKESADSDSSNDDSDDSDKDNLQKLLEDDEDTDANDDSYMPNDSNASSLADDSDDDDDDDDDEDDDDDDDEDEEDTPQSSPAKKKQEGKKQVPTPQQNGHADKGDKKKMNAENEKKLNQSQKSESVEKSPQDGKQKKVLPGNVAIEDMRVGQGAVAKSGKMVEVFYEGRLKSNNKMFDSCMKKPGFKFRLGKKEVISGWDVGITGMKIGGKRRIVCPPGMAYGNKGSPPVIPPNSTLVFDVELKGVN